MLGAPVLNFSAAEDMLYRELGSTSVSLDSVTAISNRLVLCREWLAGLLEHMAQKQGQGVGGGGAK